jgi:hypothetical protein
MDMASDESNGKFEARYGDIRIAIPGLEITLFSF